MGRPTSDIRHEETGMGRPTSDVRHEETDMSSHRRRLIPLDATGGKTRFENNCSKGFVVEAGIVVIGREPGAIDRAREQERQSKMRKRG